jgi:site-specific recombinase XerD
MDAEDVSTEPDRDRVCSDGRFFARVDRQRIGDACPSAEARKLSCEAPTTMRQPSVRKASRRERTASGLRHTFASHPVTRGAPLKAVQELLGQKTIRAYVPISAQR